MYTNTVHPCFIDVIQLLFFFPWENPNEGIDHLEKNGKKYLCNIPNPQYREVNIISILDVYKEMIKQCIESVFVPYNQTSTILFNG